MLVDVTTYPVALNMNYLFLHFKETLFFLNSKVMAIDPFFASTRKRKRSNKPTQKKQPRPAQPKNNKRDSDIEGDTDEEDHFNTNVSAESEVESSEEEIEETAAEKRVRLAKAYLESIEKNAQGNNQCPLF